MHLGIGADIVGPGVGAGIGAEHDSILDVDGEAVSHFPNSGPNIFLQI
jgi:hypothetical protein